MANSCDLCGGHDLTFAYEPEGTQRGLKVYACRACGLVQSLPRADRAPRKNATISAGADWGNVRYGKGFRVGAHIPLLTARAWPTGAPTILDVGSNRGAFISAALEAWPNASIVAVEPDERVTESYEVMPKVELLRARIEDCAFDAASFNLVYSSHTLEHVAYARRVLEQHRQVLRPDGLLLLEVPNIAVIASSDIVEEWFIDKHLYHFSPATLRALLAITGFEIVEGPKPNDDAYLTVLARPCPPIPVQDVIDADEHDRAMKLISICGATRVRNVSALRSAADAIANERGRIVVWGAGRLFDALVRQGQLDPRRLTGLIDEGLRHHTDTRHGVELSGSNALQYFDPDLVVIASRAFAGEITARVKALAPRAKIVTFTELIDQAQKSAA